MATERWLMLGSAAGGDRQSLHEVIRRHSLAVAEAVSRGEPNDLLERLATDPAFRGVPAATLQAELDPAQLHRSGGQQVREFLEEYLHPLLARALARWPPKPRPPRWGYDDARQRAGCRCRCFGGARSAKCMRWTPSTCCWSRATG